MITKIILLLLLLLVAPPAWAAISDCDQAIKAAGIPIEGISALNATDPNLRVDCSKCTNAQMIQALSIAQTPASWLAIIDTTMVQVQRFIALKADDSKVTDAMYIAAMRIRAIQTKTTRDAEWASLVSQLTSAGVDLSAVTVP